MSWCLNKWSTLSSFSTFGNKNEENTSSWCVIRLLWLKPIISRLCGMKVKIVKGRLNDFVSFVFSGNFHLFVASWDWRTYARTICSFDMWRFRNTKFKGFLTFFNWGSPYSSPTLGRLGALFDSRKWSRRGKASLKRKVIMQWKNIDLFDVNRLILDKTKIWYLSNWNNEKTGIFEIFHVRCLANFSIQSLKSSCLI